MKIVADQQIPFVREYFSRHGDLIVKPGRQISAQDVNDADMLLVRSITQVDASLLSKSKVNFVGSVTAGADHMDTAWLDKTGIQWRLAHGFNAAPVADYVVAVIAALQRKQLLRTQQQKAVVIGAGSVGSLVEKHLSQLGFDVQCCDPIRAEAENNFHSLPLEEIEDVNLISLHVPLTKKGKYPTYHFIDKAFLQRQKPGCVLINASRGAVIDTEVLLQDGSHLHQCLDVWEHEPDINLTLLQEAFIATPHIAGYSIQSKIRGVDMIYQAACELGVIEAQAVKPVEMPRQTLSFAIEKPHWQDVVLGIFNPVVLSAMMRTVLLTTQTHGILFDDMRHQFNYRHEFSFTTIEKTLLASEDKVILEALGITVKLNT